MKNSCMFLVRLQVELLMTAQVSHFIFSYKVIHSTVFKDTVNLDRKYNSWQMFYDIFEKIEFDVTIVAT